MACVLIVDGEPAVLQVMVRTVFEQCGHRVIGALSANEAITAAAGSDVDLAILDWQLPDSNGLKLFDVLRRARPRVRGLIVTGYASQDHALLCGQAGIAGYLPKPFSPAQLAGKVEDLLHDFTGVEKPVDEPDFDQMIGHSRVMLRLFELIRRLAGVDAPVLIEGATGVGKELVARALHRHSPRRSGPFVDVNCAAVPGTLFEAEFFGHEPGAFTDARQRRLGWFERAHGGTLFLDEVGELPLDAQAKLLRVIEQKRVSRLGSGHAVQVDVRLISATNRNLRQAVAAGDFRADLYWRLHAAGIRVPSLSEHQEDLDRLCYWILARLCRETGVRPTELTEEALAVLRSHDWPGNVRELEHVLLAALLNSGGYAIGPADIHLQSRDASPLDGLGVVVLLRGSRLDENVARGVELIERQLITRALATEKTVGAAARALAIDPKTLSVKRHRYGMFPGDVNDGLPEERPTSAKELTRAAGD